MKAEMDHIANEKWEKVTWSEDAKYRLLQMSISEFQTAMDDYAGYLSYRVERDLYEVILDKGMDLSLEDLMLISNKTVPFYWKLVLASFFLFCHQNVKV